CHIERDFVTLADDVDRRLSSNMPKAKLIESVWIMKREIRHDELAFQDVFDHLDRDHTGLCYFIRTDDFELVLRQGGLDKGRENCVEVLPLLRSFLADPRNKKANPLKVFRLRSGLRA